MILKAIRTALKADSTVTASLSTYDFGDGAEAAIFTVDPIPEDADLPAIVLALVGGTGDFGTRGKRGAEADVDARVYDNKTGSTARVRGLAWDIWEAINHASLTIAGYEEVGVYADPPIQAPDPGGFPGYRVPVMVRVLEN